jgi:hypothetical protein
MRDAHLSVRPDIPTVQEGVPAQVVNRPLEDGVYTLTRP